LPGLRQAMRSMVPPWGTSSGYSLSEAGQDPLPQRQLHSRYVTLDSIKYTLEAEIEALVHRTRLAASCRQR